LIVPEVGGRQLSQVQATVNGMKKLAQTLVESGPETVVFITPHGNVFQDAISILALPDLEGDLGEFGYREKVEFRNDQECLALIARAAAEHDLPLVLIDQKQDRLRLNLQLDHGILVPLYYLSKAGLPSSVRLLAVSYGLLGLERMYRFGMLLQECSQRLGRRVAVVASGDMSHRLTNDGPYSYHPDGPVFDRTIKEYLAAGKILELFDIDPSLRENAGECGYLSIITLMGVFNGLSFQPTVFSYEGPMGVGYLTAGLQPGPAPAPDLYRVLLQRKADKLAARIGQESPLVSWARRCLETYIREGRRLPLPETMPPELKEAASVFVSLKKDGNLRGCIGTLTPTRPNLAVEIQENAISAGTQDYRFLPVEPEELDDLVYSVDVLGKPEPISDISELDPRKYGVIVRYGAKSGVLLPDLQGVDTARQQVEIACQKAGIRPDQPFTMERFEVRRHH
jgi:AmmeMemoRadiSam system protein A